jgi:hypothetical protein
MFDPRSETIPLLVRFFVPLVLFVLTLLFLWRQLVWWRRCRTCLRHRRRRALRTRRRISLRRLCRTIGRGRIHLLTTHLRSSISRGLVRLGTIARLCCGRTVIPHRCFCRAIERGRIHLWVAHLRTSAGCRLITRSETARRSSTRAGTLRHSRLDGRTGPRLACWPEVKWLARSVGRLSHIRSCGPAWRSLLHEGLRSGSVGGAQRLHFLPC